MPPVTTVVVGKIVVEVLAARKLAMKDRSVSKARLWTSLPEREVN
jgi:hypothetical protein